MTRPPGRTTTTHTKAAAAAAAAAPSTTIREAGGGAQGAEPPRAQESGHLHVYANSPQVRVLLRNMLNSASAQGSTNPFKLSSAEERRRVDEQQQRVLEDARRLANTLLRKRKDFLLREHSRGAFAVEGSYPVLSCGGLGWRGGDPVGGGLCVLDV